MRAIIAITTSYRDAEERNYLNQSYAQAIHQAGGLAVLLPTEEPGMAPLYLDRVQGLLLSGGGDMDPAAYGQKPHPALGPVEPYRDRWEMALARLALERELPLFAICRGLQVLNVTAGGTLYQDIPSQVPGALDHYGQGSRSALLHEVRFGAGSSLSRILGKNRVRVNSFHHQAIDKLAPGFIVTGWAPDSIIEAVEKPNYPFLLGVQWHPEDLVKNRGPMVPLFEAFIKAARRLIKT